MRKLFGSIMVWMILAIPLMGANVASGEKVEINAPEKGNLYVAAGELIVNAPIFGDLIAAGQDIWVNDTIGEDATLAGAEIRINGVVKGDLRVGGGDIEIVNHVMGDLVIAGGKVLVADHVIVYGDLFMAGGELEMNGTINGKISMTGGEVTFNGTAERESMFKGGKLHINGVIKGKSRLSAEKITLGPDAAFYNDVAYWQKSGEMEVAGKLMEGAEAIIDDTLKWEEEQPWKYAAGGMFGFWIWRLLAGALAITLLIWAFPNFFSRTVETFYHKYLNKMGWGLLYLIAMPVLIMVLFFTVIGIPLGLAGATVYGLTLGFAHILTAVVGAFELEQYLDKTWRKRELIAVGVGLFFALKLIAVIPFVGFLITLLAVGIALGSILLTIFRRVEKPELDLGENH